MLEILGNAAAHVIGGCGIFALLSGYIATLVFLYRDRVSQRNSKLELAKVSAQVSQTEMKMLPDPNWEHQLEIKREEVKMANTNLNSIIAEREKIEAEAVLKATKKAY
jgi:hypothetical protein